MTTTQHTADKALKALAAADLVPTVANVLKVYRSATDAQLAEGIRWYDDAHSLAVALDRDNVKRSAGVIAALSPMMPWGRNVALATRAYADGFASGCLKTSCAKADAILAGADPIDVVGKGDKVRNFYLNILNPSDPCGGVTVDRHAFDIAVGRVTDDATRGVISRKGVYDAFADVYREAARIAGIGSAQMQAVTWVVWRETSIRCAAANRREAGRD
jgi:hypothetical protein